MKLTGVLPNGAKSGYRFVIEALVFGMQLCVGLVWLAPGPLFPLLMEGYHVDRAAVSWTTSVVPLGLASFALPAGIIASRIGLRKTFAIGAFLMVSGVLTPFCTSFSQLLVTRIIFSIGVAMTFPVSSGIVMQWFSGNELPVVNGINASAASFGNAIAMFTVVLITGALGFKMSLALYGAVVLVFAMAWLLLGREYRNPVAPANAGGDAPPPVSIGTALKQKTTLLLGLSMGGPFIMFMAISSWLPAYYNQVFGMPLAQASSITGLFTLFGIPGAMLGGLLPMRTGLRKPFLIIPGLLIGLAGLGTFLVNNLAINYLSVAVFGICVMIFMPPLFTLVMELPGMTPSVAAVVIATALSLGNFIGFTGPLIVGSLTDLFGSYLPGLIVCCVLSLSLLVGGLLLPETGPAAKKRPGLAQP